MIETLPLRPMPSFQIASISCRQLLRCLALCVLLLHSDIQTLFAQEDNFDPGWYRSDVSYLKIGVTEDGVFRVSGQNLLDAGASIATIDPANFHLFDHGREIPIEVQVSAAGTMGVSDHLIFVGRRNDGRDEAWAYNEDTSLISSTFFSLYSDTTTYWLTWDDVPGLRYSTPASDPPAPVLTTALRDSLHLEQNTRYFFGDPFVTGNPLYTRGEGFYWHLFSHTGNLTSSFEQIASLSNAVRTTDNLFTVRVALNGETNSRHHVELNLGLTEDNVTSLVPVDTVEWNGTAFAFLEVTLSQDRIPADGQLTVELVSRKDAGGPIGRVLLDWIDVSYVRTLSATNGHLSYSVDTPGQYNFGMNGFASPSAHLYESNSRSVFNLNVTGGTASVDFSASEPSTFWVVEDGAYLSPASLSFDGTSDLANPSNQADYVIITTPSLLATAQEMANYRSSPEGGGYQVKTVYVQDVFDQFDYGRPTPVAIRRFLRTAQSWATPPQFLLIWGDGLYPDPTRSRMPWEIPSFGNAASDGWFSMQNAGIDDYTESLATGRVPIRNNDAGQVFVDKVMNYESESFDAWQKRGLFLVGGATSSEKSILQNFALQWSALTHDEATALDTLLFFKSTDIALDPTFKDSLQVAFERGASWLTYFGHSATQTWEIVTNPPRQFDNAGKLPVVLSLGCFTGNFATGDGGPNDVLTFSEQLVSETENGAIAHWGASASGTIIASAQLGDEVHRAVFTDSVRTLGTALRMAKERYSEIRKDGLAIKHLLQYGLIGDPALRISLPTQPDFSISPAQISITPIAPIPADSQLVVTVFPQNLGLRPSDSLTLSLTHLSPDGSTTRYDERLAPFGRADSLSFDVPITDASVGENRFQVVLDPNAEYSEADEFNNFAERTQIVFSTGLSLINPLQFGLVDSTNPTLRVSIANPVPAPVIFQTDTSPTFDSQALVEHRTNPTMLTASWQPPGLKEGVTYYWRARIDNPDQPANWKNGVFTVETSLGTQGWLQQGSLFGSNEQSSFLAFADGRWSFKTFDVRVTASSNRGGSELYGGKFTVNTESIEGLGLGFGMLIIDGASGEVRGHGSMPLYANNFEDPVDAWNELESLAALPDEGDYVFVRTRNKGNKNKEVVIPDSVKDVFRTFGSIAIDTLTYSHLWLMMAHKGFPLETREWVEPPNTGLDEFQRDTTLAFSFGSGSTLSPPIGPADSWTTVGWSGQFSGNQEIHVEVLSPDLSESLIGNLDEPGERDLSGIDAVTFPFIRLRATLTDTTSHLTPQLTRWHVGYKPVAELALDPASLQFSADSLLEGQPLDISVVARNLSGDPAALSLLTYTLINAGNESILVHTDTLRQLSDTATSTFSLPTLGIVGSDRLQLNLRQPDRQESTTFNNVLIRPFAVLRDATPPSFEVLLDGEAFPNDPDPVVNLQDPALPFVSTHPSVEISVEDENPFLTIKGDTTIVSATLDDEEIPFSILAGNKQNGDNTLNLRFTPDLSGSDTTHTLVVHVQDKSANQAVGSPYQVHFRTQSETLVEKVYPYPNPMSSFTVFAFRLLGADASAIDQFRLRIYTINGRLIREFDVLKEPGLTEAGGLRIGWNKIRWDGRDEDGDRVATGVYLYKVLVRSSDAPKGYNQTSKVEKLVVIR